MNSTTTQINPNSSVATPPSPVDRRTETVAEDTKVNSIRLHYMDNVRAIAMLLGVFLHGGLAYAIPSKNFWIVGDQFGSKFLDGSIWFIHLFRMALFFLIAGYFAKFLVKRRGVKGLLWNRFVRIVCPFLLFYPFLLVAMLGTIFFAANYVTHLSPILSLIKLGIDSGQDSNEPLNTMHLWFLYYLAMFSLIAVAACRIKLSIMKRVADWVYTSPWSVLVVPLVLIPSLIFTDAPLPAPESFMPELWPFGFYGLYFLAGWHLLGRESFIDNAAKYAPFLFGAAVIGYVPYYMMLPTSDAFPPLPADSQTKIIEGSLTAFMSVFLVVTSLVWGKRFLDSHNPVLRYVSDASYWVYLVHLPLVLFIQALLVDLRLNVWLKFAITTCATFAISMAVYAVFVRYTPLGTLLNGKKPFPFWRKETV